MFYVGLLLAGLVGYLVYEKQKAHPHDAPSPNAPPQAIAGAFFTTDDDGIVTWTDNARNALIATLVPWVETGVASDPLGGQGAIMTLANPLSPLSPFDPTGQRSAIDALGAVLDTFDVWIDTSVTAGQFATVIVTPPRILPQPEVIGLPPIARTPTEAATPGSPRMVRFTRAGDLMIAS